MIIFFYIWSKITGSIFRIVVQSKRMANISDRLNQIPHSTRVKQSNFLYLYKFLSFSKLFIIQGKI